MSLRVAAIADRLTWRAALPWLACQWALWVAGAAYLGQTLALLCMLATAAAAVCVRSKRDATAFLTVVIVCLGIPANQVLPGIGTSGRPAVMVGIAGLIWILIAAGVPTISLPGERAPQPLRGALVGLFLAIIASYIAAFFRPLLPVEASAADRGLIELAGMLGFALLAAEGIADQERLDTFLRRLVLGAAILATAGIVQFFTGFDLAARIRPPGLVTHLDYEFILERNGLRRVAAMTLHPIEFGVVMATVLPIALHYAMFDTRRQAWRRIAPVVPMLLGTALALSRTATIGTVVVLLVLIPTWTPARRLKASIVGVFAVVAMKAAVPGLIGTIIALFTSWGQDGSISARTGRYGLAQRYFLETPIFGRGFATWVPDRYQIMDNEYIVTLITTGVVGFIAVAIVFMTGASLARGARRRSTDPAIRHLGQALAASISAFAVTFGTYDALSFPTATALLFLLLGCAGALWRLHRPPEELHPLDRPYALVPANSPMVPGGDR